VKVEGKHIVVGLTSPPKKGKANIELVKKIAEYFDLSSSQIKIISGLRSRNKLVEITE